MFVRLCEYTFSHTACLDKEKARNPSTIFGSRFQLSMLLVIRFGGWLWGSHGTVFYQLSVGGVKIGYVVCDRTETEREIARHPCSGCKSI